jgi:hypothetical protein
MCLCVKKKEVVLKKISVNLRKSVDKTFIIQKKKFINEKDK